MDDGGTKMSDRTNRRAEILEGAKKLFRLKGYHATTIRDIAEEAGMLSGSLYAHIKSKEDLLYEITDEVAKQFLSGMKTVTNSDAPPSEKLKAGLASHFQVIADHSDAASVFMHEWKLLSSERRTVIQQQRDAYEAMWATLLDEGADAGVFHRDLLREARMMVLSVANWSYQWFDPSGPMTPDAAARQLAAVLLRGIAKSSGIAKFNPEQPA